LNKLKQWLGMKPPSTVKATGSRDVINEYVLEPHVTQVFLCPLV